MEKEVGRFFLDFTTTIIADIQERDCACVSHRVYTGWLIYNRDEGIWKPRVDRLHNTAEYCEPTWRAEDRPGLPECLLDDYTT